MQASIGLYSVDPPGIEAFSSFDPESYFAILAIAEGLITIGLEGEVVPALATSWDQVDALTWEFELRQGVTFHDGSPFDAGSVEATFRHHRIPDPSPTAQMFDAIERVEVLDPFRVRIVTRHPDAMLLRRLYFLVIYPAHVLETEGRAAIVRHPVGTGPYRLKHWKRGEEILLQRYEQHWLGRGGSDLLSLPIVRQKEWVQRLERGELAAVLNLDAHDAVRASRVDGVQVGHREAALSQWFLLAHRGPLADTRVRRALNLAVKRSLIAEISEHGMATPQRSVATPGSHGHVDLPPVRYCPELARRELAEAGHPEGFTLHGIVSESSTGVYFAVREFLCRIGVELHAEIVPRSEWMRRVAGAKQAGTPYEGDFAVALVDNPLVDSLFHQYIFFFSQGPMSLMSDPAYDEVFLRAATTVGEEGLEARHELERFVVDQASFILTQQQEIHAAWREGSPLRLPASGHFNTAFWWELELDPSGPAIARPRVPADGDVSALLQATSHTGTFFLPDEDVIQSEWARLLWRRLQISEARWRITHEPMLRELVTQLESRNDLASVLGSTERVAIVGYTLEGRPRFQNAGYATLLDGHPGHVGEVVVHPSWATIEAGVRETGSWLGPVTLDRAQLPGAPSDTLFLTAALARDDEGAPSGFTLVFSDFSGEEERIRNQAIRVVLDNVPYGLFVVGQDGRLRSGYSVAAHTLFPGHEDLEGHALSELLGLAPRDAANLDLAIDQVFMDLLPEEVSTGQIPARVFAHGRHLSLEASVIRDATGRIEGLLFTSSDITDLIAAEADVVEMRGAVEVLRFRDRFQDFVWNLFDTLAELEARHGLPGWELRARRELHTAKGVFGQFELVGLQRHVHALEEAGTLGPTQLRSLRAALEETLAAHRDLWGIPPRRQAGRYEVASTVVEAHAERAASATTAEELREILESLLAEVRSRSAEHLLGPVVKQAEQLAERRGKTVDVVLEGGEVGVPVRLLPAFDQLGHLVRNAVDHGIEPPEARGEKPSRARLRIAVARSGPMLQVVLEDDGAGIPVQRLRDRAVERGLLGRESADGLSDAEALHLIFADGLSTAAEVSTTSGRGVGMAAVRGTVEELGGHLSVQSRAGEGTRFVLELPVAAGPVAQGDQRLPVDPVF